MKPVRVLWLLAALIFIALALGHGKITAAAGASLVIPDAATAA
jgi:hypothetical protein